MFCEGYEIDVCFDFESDFHSPIGSIINQKSENIVYLKRQKKKAVYYYDCLQLNGKYVSMNVCE